MVAIIPDPRFSWLGEWDATTPAKQGAEVRQMVTAMMEGVEAILVEFLKAEIKTAREEMNLHMTTVDQRLEHQGAKIEEIQLKVTMPMDSIGQV